MCLCHDFSSSQKPKQIRWWAMRTLHQFSSAILRVREATLGDWFLEQHQHSHCSRRVTIGGVCVCVCVCVWRGGLLFMGLWSPSVLNNETIMTYWPSLSKLMSAAPITLCGGTVGLNPSQRQSGRTTCCWCFHFPQGCVFTTADRGIKKSISAGPSDIVSQSSLKVRSSPLLTERR